VKARIASFFLLAVAAASLRAGISPDSGLFQFHNYTAKDFNASPQNWAMVEDRRGVMYIGNTDGVLEFDGVNWRLIPLATAAQALAEDSSGTIFVGGSNTMGYLAPDSHGEMKFISLLDKLPKANQIFGTIFDILPTADGVYFCSKRALFLFSKGGAVAPKMWTPSHQFGRAFTAYEELFVTATDRGLLRVVKGELTPSVEGDAKLVRKSPMFAPGATPDQRPILANGQNLFHFSLSAIDPFPTKADAYFVKNNIQAVSQWASGEIAVGTSSGGVVVLDQSGEIKRILTKKSGLPSDIIRGFYTDHQGGVWISTDAGVARSDPALSSLGEEQGLRGGVTAIGQMDGSVYAGTTLGLFRLQPSPGVEPTFEPVASLQQPVYTIAKYGNILLVGAIKGLFSVSGQEAKLVFPTDVVYGVSFSRKDPDLVYICGRDGVQALKLNGGKWTVVAKESKGEDFLMSLEDSDGRVWATTMADIWSIDFRSQPPVVKRFGPAEGVPERFKYVYMVNGHPAFTTTKGLLRFSERSQRFVPDAELGLQFSDGTHSLSLVLEDKSQNIWVVGEGYDGVLLKQRAGGYRLFSHPLLETGINSVWAMLPEENGTVWASGDGGGLFRYESPAKPFGAASDFSVLLRRVTTTAREQVLFSGDGANKVSPQLPYSDNALRFEFAAPFPENQAKVEYQVKLEGTDKQWSPWTTETRKDYTNLPERRYTFRVRARNPHDVVTSDAVYAFTVSAPWYRTWPAYAVYVAAFLFAGWLILRWRLQALEAKNKWLEHMVEERTAEVRTERDQNVALLLNILPSPVATELRSTGAVKPTAFDDVTVCFSDFVGFTLSSENLPAEELISSLNEYFTAFDEIIGRYGLEKLKTIGDSYMFASGLPTVSPSHAVDAVLAALEMVAVTRRLARPDKGVNWSIRLGLYSGPVVAGVVGKRKFAFDIWGNTVNFAARMESSGAPDRVNLSQSTCALVSDFIECEPRGLVRIKEGREMEMFFAVKPKQDLLMGPLEDGVPKAFRERYQEAYAVAPKSFPDPAIFGETLMESQPV
jgi:class 3 adenylate cyclase